MDTDAIAKQVADAMAANDFWSAVSLLGGLSRAELDAVSAKAISLGVSPADMKQVVDQLATTETIEVSGSAPGVTVAGVLALAALAALFYAAKRRRRH